VPRRRIDVQRRIVDARHGRLRQFRVLFFQRLDLVLKDQDLLGGRRLGRRYRVVVGFVAGADFSAVLTGLAALTFWSSAIFVSRHVTSARALRRRLAVGSGKSSQSTCRVLAITPASA